MSEAAHLLELEARLLDAATRRSVEVVAALLDEEFVEFGASGARFDRAALLAAWRDEQTAERRMTAARARLLAPDVALVTYDCVRIDPDGSALQSRRTSVWRRRDGAWRMLHHQGTRV